MADQNTHYTIEISATTGMAGLDGMPGRNGVNSPDTKTGQNGSDGSVSGWITKKCKCATNGQPGAAGVSGGTTGNDGTAGGTPPWFVLNVNTLKIVPTGGKLNIKSSGGSGGSGGNGGKGGDGAPGGDAGTNVASCITNGSCQPGQGGIGGAGAPGGQGGKGGNGGNGGSIALYYVDNKFVDRIVPDVDAGSGGDPGDQGLGGDGGKGGRNEIFPPGSAQTFAPDGDPGAVTGNKGSGQVGKPGTYNIHKVSQLPPTN
jgi:hypothetical protein